MKRTSLLLGVLFLLPALLLVGCNQGDSDRNDDPPPRNPLFEKDKRKPGLIGNILRKKDEIEINNDLKNIALFYQMYSDTFRRPPQKVEDFLKYIKRDAGALYQSIEQGEYIVITGVRFGSHQTVIAYEKQGGPASTHQVAMADGSIQTLGATELQQALHRR
jgi:hypothetical protein